MDPKTEFESLKQELIDLGFTQEKLDELLLLGTEEILDIAITSLEQSEDDTALEELANMLQTPPTTQEEAAEKMNKVFTTAYGDNAETKKLELLNQYLKDTIEMTKKSKDLLDRYSQEDPTAIAAIQSNIDDPDAQKIQASLTE
ncbi:hypothetical protein A3J98_01430 [candidate division WS6 bacterium RIFOXYC1_FULL_33_10]|uniref:Uncharacterized protein n=2 Tax=Candidatus Dojkabacteria TaxID=74243 RepID=A0A1F4UGI1_9BACT|nr:MAG: hypothetical protein A2400_02135 [candidate division WS6 bacterium RIFOXYB1_FULL_33_14]OGC46127.1 MAG: hypothetical protein A3J98_01430 [candidate division WS6 bacterium RIFOXYC1_FULL_33_10]